LVRSKKLTHYTDFQFKLVCRRISAKTNTYMRFEILCKIWSFHSGMYSTYQSPGLWCLLALPVDTNISEESTAFAFKVKVADYIDKLRGGSMNDSKGTVPAVIQLAQWTAKLSIQICQSIKELFFILTFHMLKSHRPGPGFIF